MYDEVLFEIASQEYIRLANANKPFNLTFSTMDSHFPGKPSPSCQAYSHQKDSNLDAVHCTDQLLEKFINKISRHPSFKNTVVVMVTDHLAMRNSAAKFYPKNYKRKLFFSILNIGIKAYDHTPGTHMDIAPTILEAIGVKHNAHFLAGRNLFDKSTVVHTDFFSDERMQALRYINTHFLTETEGSLCKGEFLVKSETQQTLKIGNKNIVLSFRGWSIAEHKFKNDLTIVAFIEDNGAIKNSSVVFSKDLLQILVANKEDIFLIITPRLNDITMSADGTVSVLFGKLDRTIIHLGSFTDLQNIQIDGSNCEKLIRTVQRFW